MISGIRWRSVLKSRRQVYRPKSTPYSDDFVPASKTIHFYFKKTEHKKYFSVFLQDDNIVPGECTLLFLYVVVYRRTFKFSTKLHLDLLSPWNVICLLLKCFSHNSVRQALPQTAEVLSYELPSLLLSSLISITELMAWNSFLIIIIMMLSTEMITYDSYCSNTKSTSNISLVMTDAEAPNTKRQLLIQLVWITSLQG